MKTKILKKEDFKDYLNHLLELKEHDLYLRFGYNVSKDGLFSYVERTKNCANSYVIAIYYKEKIIAACHLYYFNKTAEIGISVLEGYRGQGLATYLINILVYKLMVKEPDVSIELHVINSNLPIKRLISKYNDKFTLRPKLKEIIL